MTATKKQQRNKECFFCHLEATVVHHIDTDRQNNEKINLLDLCDSCHRKLHVVYRRMLKSGVFMRNRIRKMSGRTETGIKDITKIYEQYKAGVSILALSTWWDISYATLYRALKKVDRDESKKEKEKGNAQGP